MTKTTQLARDYTAERNKRCIPVAIELLKRLGAHDDLLIGDIQEGDKEAIEWYGKFYMEETIPLFMEKKLTVDDSKFVFRLMQQAIAFAQGRTDLTLDFMLDKATAKKWGVEDVAEITLDQLQAELMRPVDKPVDAEEKKDVS